MVETGLSGLHRLYTIKIRFIRHLLREKSGIRVVRGHNASALGKLSLVRTPAACTGQKGRPRLVKLFDLLDGTNGIDVGILHQFHILPIMLQPHRAAHIRVDIMMVDSSNLDLFVVQLQHIAVNCHFPKPDLSFEGMSQPVIGYKANVQFIQPGTLGIPQLGLVNVKGHSRRCHPPARKDLRFFASRAEAGRIGQLGAQPKDLSRIGGRYYGEVAMKVAADQSGRTLVVTA